MKNAFAWGSAVQNYHRLAESGVASPRQGSDVVPMEANSIHSSGYEQEELLYDRDDRGFGGSSSSSSSASPSACQKLRRFAVPFGVYAGSLFLQAVGRYLATRSYVVYMQESLQASGRRLDESGASEALDADESDAAGSYDCETGLSRMTELWSQDRTAYCCFSWSEESLWPADLNAKKSCESFVRQDSNLCTPDKDEKWEESWSMEKRTSCCRQWKVLIELTQRDLSSRASCCKLLGQDSDCMETVSGSVVLNIAGNAEEGIITRFLTWKGATVQPVEMLPVLVFFSFFIATLVNNHLELWARSMIVASAVATMQGLQVWAAPAAGAEDWGHCRLRLGDTVVDELEHARNIAGNISCFLLSIANYGIWTNRVGYCADTLLSAHLCASLIFSLGSFEAAWFGTRSLKRCQQVAVRTMLGVLLGLIVVAGFLFDMVTRLQFSWNTILGLILVLLLWSSRAFRALARSWATGVELGFEGLRARSIEDPDVAAVLSPAGWVTLCCFPWSILVAPSASTPPIIAATAEVGVDVVGTDGPSRDDDVPTGDATSSARSDEESASMREGSRAELIAALEAARARLREEKEARKRLEASRREYVRHARAEVEKSLAQSHRAQHGGVGIPETVNWHPSNYGGPPSNSSWYDAADADSYDNRLMGRV